MSALALAVLVTLLMARWIKVQRARRTEEMRFLAGLAVARAEQLQLADTAKDESLINLCAKLSSEKADTIRVRAKFYASIDPESAGYYLPRDSPEQAAIYLVALLTDLPPGWLFDSLVAGHRALYFRRISMPGYCRTTMTGAISWETFSITSLGVRVMVALVRASTVVSTMATA